MSGRPPSGSEVTAVIVSYGESPAQLREAVAGVSGQEPPVIETLVVDNGSRLEPEDVPGATVLAPGGNIGYGSAVNLAARHAAGDFILCLNPDAVMEAGCLGRLTAVAETDRRVALVGAQILLADGETRNAGANPLHPVGISPSGGYGTPRESGAPADVMVVSGACCLIRSATFAELGGYAEELFMYYEDVDLAWRARIAGHRVVYCPQAAVRHGYEFSRNKRKWFYLERNRILSVLANYEARTLALLAPLLLGTELGLLAVAGAGGWLPEKLEAYRAVASGRASLRARRARVQASRRVPDAELIELFQDELDSALLPAFGARLANLVCRPYLWLVRRLLRGWAR